MCSGNHLFEKNVPCIVDRIPVMIADFFLVIKTVFLCELWVQGIHVFITGNGFAVYQGQPLNFAVSVSPMIDLFLPYTHQAHSLDTVGLF